MAWQRQESGEGKKVSIWTQIESYVESADDEDNGEAMKTHRRSEPEQDECISQMKPNTQRWKMSIHKIISWNLGWNIKKSSNVVKWENENYSREEKV